MENKRVAVVGGAGFLGSHLVDHLIENNNHVIVLDNLIVGRKEFINKKAQFIWCDITHSEFQLIKIFRNNKIDYVFNYAAEPYVPQSYERPLHILEINAVGALMVLNASEEAGVKKVLQVSSAEIYGDVMKNLITVDHPAHPHSTYGASKLAIDCIVQTRFRESGCPGIALRQFNCIGERDVLHPYVVPEIYRQALSSDIIRLGNNTFRDFIYAKDAVRIAVDLLEKGTLGEVYNLGSEEGIKIYDLARMIGIFMGKELIVEEEESRKRKWEVWHLQSDNTKIYGIVDSKPEVSLEEAVKRTIHYYNENPDKWGF